MKGKNISGDTLAYFFRLYDEIEAECDAAMKYACHNIQEPEEYIRMRDLQCKYSALNLAIDYLGLKKSYIDWYHTSKRGEI